MPIDQPTNHESEPTMTAHQEQLREQLTTAAAKVNDAPKRTRRARPTTDTRRPGRSKMTNAVAALRGCVADLELYAGDAGMSYLVADRLERLASELEKFSARDLVNSREATS